MTVFSFGAGQESMYILLRLIFDPAFYARHVIGELIVVGSDTGAEHPHTYKAVYWAMKLCYKHGIKFYWVMPKHGFHSKTWHSLSTQYVRNSSVGSAAFRQSCTDNLKVKVVDRFVENYLAKKHGVRRYLKLAYYRNYTASGPIRLILGFAKGEERRTSNGNKFDPVWKQKCVVRHYPLIEDGVDRAECIGYNSTQLPFSVFPSNCMICFYQSDQEVLWLNRNYPQVFAEWVDMERAKLEKHQDKEKNFGVYGKITLTQKLEKAERLYGHWSDEQLNDYKFSHGHCIKSKY